MIKIIYNMCCASGLSARLADQDVQQTSHRMVVPLERPSWVRHPGHPEQRKIAYCLPGFQARCLET